MKGVVDGVHDRRHRTDRPGFTYTFYAKRIARRRHLVCRNVEIAEIIRPRHAVILERPSDQLTGFRIVVNVFHQNLACALHNTAMDLAVEQDGVENGAGIVYRGIAYQRDLAGIRVDLDFCQMGAIGKTGAWPCPMPNSPCS
jgi:hypothetical protein